jgi:hypothetical protein
MGDAVPDLVVKMSCQLPSIKLELVCRETIKIKSEAFHFIFFQIIFRLVDCTHINGDVFLLRISSLISERQCETSPYSFSPL